MNCTYVYIYICIESVVQYNSSADIIRNNTFLCLARHTVLMAPLFKPDSLQMLRFCFSLLLVTPLLKYEAEFESQVDGQFGID